MKFTAVLLYLVVACKASMDEHRQLFEVGSNLSIRLPMIYADRRRLTPLLMFVDATGSIS